MTTPSIDGRRGARRQLPVFYKLNDSVRKTYYKPRYFLLRLWLRADDGNEMETWCGGASEKEALRKWKADHPAMAARLVRHRVTTPRAKQDAPMVEVEDLALKNVAVGL
jgi:hypothetical protein